MSPGKLFDIFKKRGEIFEGIANTIFKKEHVELIANERWKICKKCELVDLTGDTCVAPGTQPCCSDCGCSLAFKMRSLSSACPLHKWDAIMTEEEESKLNIDGNII